MADQTYNLTQTGAEVQAIINDANGVKGAGATTSLTTDYIMLKDTSGAYHKIQKSSFTEAVRNTLASLLVNNDKGTTISQIAAIASGDFGSVTPDNLASVLGAAEINELPANADLDNYKDIGKIYTCQGTNLQTVQNSPTRAAFILEVFALGSYSTAGRYQRITSCNANSNIGNIYIRFYSFNSGNWTNWFLFEGTPITT